MSELMVSFFVGFLLLVLMFFMSKLVRIFQRLRAIDVLEDDLEGLHAVVSCIAGSDLDEVDEGDIDFHAPRFSKLSADVSALQADVQDLTRQIRLLQEAVSSLRLDR